MDAETTSTTASPIQFFDTDTRNSSLVPVICYPPTMVSIYGVWLNELLLNYTMPLFLLQILLIIPLTRAIHFLLQPLRQPRYISEIIGGFLLGPALMGRIPGFSIRIFPLRSLLVFEAVAHLGLIYYIFTVGVEVETRIVASAGIRRSLAFASAAVLPSFSIGIIAALAVHPQMGKSVDACTFFIFIGVVFSVTALSALARILAELKMIGSEVGRMALSSAMLVDGWAWLMLALAVPLAETNGTAEAAAWVCLSGLGFVGFCFGAVRPAVQWVVSKTPEGEELGELAASGILAGVLAAAFVSDAIGAHSIFGAFVYGMAVPNGPVGEALVEKVEDFVEGLLLPLFFVFTGLRANVYSIVDLGATAILAVGAAAGAAAKVAGAVALAHTYKMPVHDGLSMGMLMNTKGVMELVVLNIGKDKRVLSDQPFTILMIMSVVVTALVGPLLAVLVKPVRRFGSYKRRTVRWPNPDSELRIIACVHTPRNVPALIAFLDASTPTKRSPIFVYALHLVELTGRASAMLLASAALHAQKDSSAGGGRVQTQSDHIMSAFETYEQHAAGVSVQPLTTFSRYSTMHEDVLAVAEERHAALVLLPFHKHRTVDGVMEVTHTAVRSLNRTVLASARCSVGVLVDRGFGGSAVGRTAHRVAVLFLGGPDDREALACAARMVQNPGTALTVLRLVPPPSKGERVVTVSAEGNRERRADEECVSELRALGREAVTYVEKMSGNAEETVAAIKSMEDGHDLYIVGRGQGEASQMTVGLTDFTECPELGPVGDFLASSDFAAAVSVLVVQRGGGGAGGVGPAVEAEGAALDSPRKQVRLYVYNDRAPQTNGVR